MVIIRFSVQHFKKMLSLFALFLVISTSSYGQILISTSNSNGTVPGTSITYTITSSGTPRDIMPGITTGTSEWSWAAHTFPEFLNGAALMTMTVAFSAPVEINRFTFAVTSAVGDFTITPTGGTATRADFDLADGLLTPGVGTYTPGTGIINLPASDNALMIGSTSSNTVTNVVLSGTNTDGGDGYTMVFGLKDAPPPAVPVSPFAVVGSFILIGLFLYIRSNRKLASNINK